MCIRDRIYGFAGAPNLGADGSAYSTVIVELIALLWCILESHKPERIRPDKKGLQWFSRPITKDFIGISLPMLGSALAWGVGFSLHSLIMGHLGSDAVAGEMCIRDRAYCLEKELDTPAKIYYKFEGNNTSGSHKLNSAIAQAYYAKQLSLIHI